MPFEIALQAFEGALILVSHDRHLLRNSAEELLLVHDGTVREYSEDWRSTNAGSQAVTKTGRTKRGCA